MARTAPAWVVPNITSFDIELREAFGSLEQYLASGKVGIGPQGPPGPPGAGLDEVVVQTTTPVDPNDLDMWFDPDAVPITGPGGAWIAVTQAQYDAMPTPRSATTLYVVIG